MSNQAAPSRTSSDEPSNSPRSPRLMASDEIPDGTPGELLPPSQSQSESDHNDDSQNDQQSAPASATSNVPDNLVEEEEEELIFRMSPVDESGPSAPDLSSSNVPTADIHQEMSLRPHKQRPLVLPVRDIPRSNPSGPDIVPRAVPTQPFETGPGEQARNLKLAGTLGGDGTAGIHPSECPEHRGTKRKVSLGDIVAETRGRFKSFIRRISGEGKRRRKGDKQ